MQARFYLPMYGRFASPDPARDQHFEQTQSWNIYSYVQNNPVMKTDPTGMEVLMSEEEKKAQRAAQIKSGSAGFHSGEKAVAKEIAASLPKIVPRAIGVTVGTQAEAGVIVPGASVQGSATTMAFINGKGETETGAVVTRNVGTALGAIAAVGAGATISNAKSTDDLKGRSAFVSFTAGAGPLKIGLLGTISSSGIYTFTISPPFAGLTSPSLSFSGGVSDTILSTKPMSPTP